jgi:protein-S-isoprenylcysteine O-methyltransferase Ste14
VALLLLFFAFFVGACGGRSPVFADDVSLGVSVKTTNQDGVLKIRNTGDGEARGIQVGVELDGKVTAVASGIVLGPGEVRSFDFTVPFPDRPGSYPLITSVTYLNEGRRLSFRDVGAFHFQKNREVSPRCEFTSDFTVFRRERSLVLCEEGVKSQPYVVTAFEVRAELSPVAEGVYELVVEEDVSPLSLRAPISLIEEWRTEDGENVFAVTRAQLEVSSDYQSGTPIPSQVLVIFLLLGVAVVFGGWRAAEESGSAILITVVRGSFTVAVLSFGLLFFQEIDRVSEWCALLIGKYWFSYENEAWGIIVSWVLYLLNQCTYEGRNYHFFALYFAVPLYLYALTANFFVLYRLVKPEPESDKYWQLMRAIIAPVSRRARGFDRSLAKVGMLTIGVKFFFVPLVVSWTIGNFYHARDLFVNFEFKALYLNAVLLHLLIMLDVLIFTFGYLTELPQLKNKIRSVEPTVFGWVICLMCYPPFNQFSFLPFDHQLFPYVSPFSETVQNLALVPILVLWSTYTWASVALGFKASNLTNRGIVSHGPYRYLRHPAYASKVSLWCIEGVILGKYYLTLCLAFIVVYGLRAYTEERHLSRDPDYLAYCKKVRTRFIPRWPRAERAQESS